MKKELTNKKNIIVIAGIILILVVVILLIVFNPFAKNKSSKNNNKVTTIKNKEDLIEVLTDKCNEYYQEYYYTTLEKEDLKEHTEFGINISLKSIGLAMAFSEEIESNLKKYECDTDASKIRFYPTSPYKSTDYTMKTDIICKK